MTSSHGAGIGIRGDSASELLLVMLLALLPLSAAADVDDLQARLSTVTGRERVDVLNELSKSQWGVSAEQTIAFADEALELARETGYEAGEACAIRYKGIGFWYMDDYDTALDLLLKALDIYERIGDDAGVAGCRSTIGTIYLNLERFDLALQTYREALALAEKVGDENRIGILLSNIGTTYLGLEKPEEALGYFQRALEILEKRGSQLDVLTALGNIGGAQRRLERYDEALEVNARILKIAAEVDSKVRMADALTDTGQILIKLHRYDEAERYLRSALDLATKEGLKRNEYETELVLVDLYEAGGDYSAALNHLRRHGELRGEIFNQENARAIAELRLKFETARNERELKARELELERQKSSRNLLITVSLVVLVLAIANYGRFRAKKRENELLERLSRTDPLTGLANRRSVLESLEREYRRMQRDERPFSLVLADIDRFKAVNDEYGHDLGDEVLVRVADALRSSVRRIDEVSRWGGEEFLVLLPDCERDEAVRTAERIREQVKDVRVLGDGDPLGITATFGVSTIREGESIDQCLKRADVSLYEGKARGRDMVVAEEPASI